jgi:hypothetical protein
VEAPDLLTGLRIKRSDDAANPHVTASGADDDLIFHDKRRMSN